MTNPEVSLRVIFDLFLLSFCIFVFSGGYKGAAPPYSTFLSCLKSFIRHPEVFAFSLVFKYCGPLIETFRGDRHGGLFLRVIFTLFVLSFRGIIKGFSSL